MTDSKAFESTKYCTLFGITVVNNDNGGTCSKLLDNINKDLLSVIEPTLNENNLSILDAIAFAFLLALIALSQCLYMLCKSKPRVTKHKHKWADGLKDLEDEVNITKTADTVNTTATTTVPSATTASFDDPTLATTSASISASDFSLSSKQEKESNQEHINTSSRIDVDSIPTVVSNFILFLGYQFILIISIEYCNRKRNCY